MMKASAEDFRRAMADLKQAFSLSSVDNDGKLACYEINGTAKAIVIAVNALTIIRGDGREDGDGDV